MWFFWKKKKSTANNVEQTENAPESGLAVPTDISIKVLGSGCAKCAQLEEATKLAIAQLGIDAPIEHVTDFGQIAAYGVMSTPALVVDGKVLSFGKVLKVNEITKLLQNHWGKHEP